MRRRAAAAHPEWEKAAQNGDHLAKCSCHMCGNPRRHWKGDDALTLQERKANESEDAA